MLPRLVHLAVGQLADVPQHDDWLGEDEREVLARLKLEKRRLEWRLGRWLARQAVRDALAASTQRPSGDVSAEEATSAALAAGRRAAGEASAALPDPEGFPPIMVLAASDGAPEVHGAAQPISLSLSHRHGRGLAAATLGTLAVGCDLELLEPRSDRFIRDWLTHGESSHIFRAPESHRALLANLCWSAKEGASKVLRVGLRFDTRSFEVALPRSEDLLPSGKEMPADAIAIDWRPLAVTAVKNRQHYAGFWRLRENFVETVLAADSFQVSEGTA